MGISHQFNHEFAQYNSICRAFVYNAYHQKKIFIKAYDEKVHNFDDVYSIGIDLLYARLSDSIDLALTVIKEIRDIDITPKEFFNISKREGNINIGKYLQPINEAKKTIDTVIEEIADYRKKERALQDLTKSKSNIGKGYDVAGWLLDGAINLAADAVRGAGHMYTDSKDRKKVNAYKLQLFQDMPIGNQPNMSAYLKDIVEPICFEVFAGVRPIIGLYSVLYEEDIQNSVNLINKVKSYRPVTPDEVVNGIFRYPYEIQLYEMLFELNPDTYSELITLANYVGIDEKFNDLMSTKIVDWVKRGFNAKKAGEYKKALKYFTLASQAGSAESMALVGSMYARGEGVDQDDAKAQEWYSKSAELGNIEAMHVLGHLLLETSSHQDFKKSLYWFQKAADKGNTDSMLMLAEFYRNGKGVPVNSKLAIDWYQKASAAGNKEAAAQLAQYEDELLQIEEDSLNDKRLLRRAQSAMNEGKTTVALRCYQKSADKGNLKAMLKLAEIYEDGIIVKKDFNKSFKLYLKAAEKGDISSMVKVGEYYADGRGVTKDLKEAHKFYEKAAQKGNSTAILQLARNYENGSGVEKNLSTALKWYSKSADSGNYLAHTKIVELKKLIEQDAQKRATEKLRQLEAMKAQNKIAKARTLSDNLPDNSDTAQESKSSSHSSADVEKSEEFYELGLKYYKGDGIPQDFDKAWKYFDLAAQSGNVDAIYHIGLMHEHESDYGKLKNLSRDMALSAFTTAAEKGHIDAMLKLGDWYRNQSDFEKAFQYFEKAANAGNRDAMYDVGLMYLNGTGVKQNAKMAMDFLKKAAKEGNINAVHLLGDSYYSEEDFQKAFQFYLRAAETGHSGSMKCIGDMYYYGKGVVKDLNKSMAWYIRVAETGDTDAMIKIGNMYDCGEGVSKSQKKAAEWFTRAAELGSITAMLYIAEMYSEGEGVSKSQKKAAEWYTRAAELGNITAMRYIASRYVHGDGVPKDLNNALKWYLKILESGETTAAVDIGSMYEQNNEFELALQWYNKALKEYGLQYAQRFIYGLEKKQKESDNTSQSDGCFITTAVCGNFGKSDDCYELTAFRKFRDTWLVHQPDGKCLIDEYYKIAPQIVDNISHLKNSSTIYETIWKEYLAPCLSFIETDQNQSCKLLYIEMVTSLKEKYL